MQVPQLVLALETHSRYAQCMSDNEYFIFPATVTRDDEGHVRATSPAALNANDGTERVWRFDTTAEAKDAADIWFGVTSWKRDDLGTLWSQKEES